jgi:hypothetical protein
MACKLVERQAQSVSSNRLITDTTNKEPRDDISFTKSIGACAFNVLAYLNHASCIEATTAGFLLDLPSLNYGVDLRLDSA